MYCFGHNKQRMNTKPCILCREIPLRPIECIQVTEQLSVMNVLGGLAVPKLEAKPGRVHKKSLFAFLRVRGGTQSLQKAIECG